MSSGEMNRLIRAGAQPRLQMITENGRTRIVAVKDEEADKNETKEANDDNRNNDHD